MPTKETTSQAERKRQALRAKEDAAYKALREAEDELFALEDRVERRGNRPTLEGE